MYAGEASKHRADTNFNRVYDPILLSQCNQNQSPRTGQRGHPNKPKYSSPENYKHFFSSGAINWKHSEFVYSTETSRDFFRLRTAYLSYVSIFF